MKVACQQCGTAYSVADDKVAGRKVKLRCKHCNEAMIIDGTKLHSDAHDAPTNLSVVASATTPNAAVASAFPVQAPVADAAATPVALSAPLAPAFDAPLDIGFDAPVDVAPAVDPATAAWHVAVGDETQGPYTLDELARHYADGQIASDTLVYYDGADDWQEASEVEALTQAASAFWQRPARPSVPPPPAPEARRFEPVAAPMGRDPFEERVAVAASPRLSTASMMDSEARHEGTVQFSIDQIRAISSVSSPSLMPVASSGGMRAASVGYEAGASSYASLAASGSSASYASRPGYASGGDSGLIDVSSLSASEPSPFRSIADAQLSPLDTHTTPLVVPLQARNSGLDARTKVFAGLSALGFVLAAGVAALALLRTPAAQPVAVSNAQSDIVQATVVGTPGVQPVAAPAPEPAAVAEREAPQAAAPREDGNDQAEAEAAAPRIASREHSSHAANHVSAKRSAPISAKIAAAVEPKEPKEAKEPKAAKAAPKASADSDFDDLLANGPKKPAASKGGSPSIDDLLDGAVSAKKQPPKSEPAETKSNLPAAPSRDAMLAALGKAKTKVGKCKGPGVATADISVAGSGKVSNVVVTGVEGAAKSCVENAVRSTPFPKFQKDVFQVKFPFKLPG